MKYLMPLSGLLLVVLLGACASKPMEPFHPAPEYTNKHPEIKIMGNICDSTKMGNYEKTWAMLTFNLDEYGKPTNISAENRYPQEVGEYCYIHNFKEWRFQLPPDHSENTTYEFLFETRRK